METDNRKQKAKSGEKIAKTEKKSNKRSQQRSEQSGHPPTEPAPLIASEIALTEALATHLPEDPSSFLDKIKLDWSLFWHGVIGDEQVELTDDAFRNGRLQVLNVEQIKQITRALSQDRKKINQRMEQVNREIDLITERIESLNLVGSDVTDSLEQISKLHDIGQQLSHQLAKVSEQLGKFRGREDELKAAAST